MIIWHTYIKNTTIYYLNLITLLSLRMQSYATQKFSFHKNILPLLVIVNNPKEELKFNIIKLKMTSLCKKSRHPKNNKINIQNSLRKLISKMDLSTGKQCPN